MLVVAGVGPRWTKSTIMSICYFVLLCSGNKFEFHPSFLVMLQRRSSARDLRRANQRQISRCSNRNWLLILDLLTDNRVNTVVSIYCTSTTIHCTPYWWLSAMNLLNRIVVRHSVGFYCTICLCKKLRSQAVSISIIRQNPSPIARFSEGCISAALLTCYLIAFAFLIFTTARIDPAHFYIWSVSHRVCVGRNNSFNGSTVDLY